MASEKMTVARAMVKALEAEGITTVFGYSKSITDF